MDELREAIKFAREVAEDSPEKYHVAVFMETLRWRLSGGKGPDTAGARETKTVTKPVVPADPPVPAHSVSKNGSRKQQTVFAVIILAGKGEEAINETIRQVIKTELSLTPQSRMDTNRTLKSLTPKYLRRERREKGSGLRYLPTAHSVGIFDGLKE